jgi:hypothetical protein
MTRLALFTTVALVLTALPSSSALPPPETGIGPVPFRPERFHDFRNDEPDAKPTGEVKPQAGLLFFDGLNGLAILTGPMFIPATAPFESPPPVGLTPRQKP